MPKSSKMGFTIQPYQQKPQYGIVNFNPGENKIVTQEEQGKSNGQSINSYDGKNATTNMPQQGKY